MERICQHLIKIVVTICISFYVSCLSPEIDGIIHESIMENEIETTEESHRILKADKMGTKLDMLLLVKKDNKEEVKYDLVHIIIETSDKENTLYKYQKGVRWLIY